MQQYKKDNVLSMILNAELRSLGTVATNVISALNTRSESNDIETIILKDAALTAQIIKIANSSKSKSDIQRQSLHEAIVRIGYDGLRSICICIGIIENIPLRNHDQRIMIFECLHRSFETAIHAESLTKKMMGSDSKGSYIAGLLCNIGELAFLSSPIINLKEYNELTEIGLTPEMACLSLSGFDFDELSQQIVEEWELSALISDAFNSSPETVQGKVIKVAFEITRAYYSGQNSKAFIEVSKRLVGDFGFSLKETVVFVDKGIEISQIEFNRYGSILQDKTDSYREGTVQNNSDNNSSSRHESARPLDSSGQKGAMAKFLDLAKKNASTRVFYSILADSLYGYTSFDRVVIAEVRNNSELKATNVSGAGAQELFAGFNFKFAFGKSVISEIIETQKSLYISKHSDPETYEDVDDNIKSLADVSGEFYISPIIKNGRVISIVYMDMGEKRLPISGDQIRAATVMVSSLSKAISTKLI